MSREEGHSLPRRAEGERGSPHSKGVAAQPQPLVRLLSWILSGSSKPLKVTTKECPHL